jgi:hypothetical protein
MSIRELKIAEHIVASCDRMSCHHRIGLTFGRDSYVPRNIEFEKITPEGTDLDIRVYEQNGVLYGVAFAGKANKPLWNYRFSNRAQLEKEIEKTTNDRKSHMDFAQKRQQERKQFSHTLKEGDILYSSWGYDQTNIDFYQVVEAKEKAVLIRKIGSKTFGRDQVVPNIGNFTGPAMLKLVRSGNGVRISSYAAAYPWDGKPKYETPIGMGH